MPEDKRRAQGEDLVALAASAFAGVCAYAWLGRLGLGAMGLLVVAVVALARARKKLEKPARLKVDKWAKALFTVAGLMALLRHPIKIPVLDPETGATLAGGGVELPIYAAIAEYVGQVEAGTFFLFAFLAMAVKFTGVIASSFGWQLLLRGQGVRFPFWSLTFTSLKTAKWPFSSTASSSSPFACPMVFTNSGKTRAKTAWSKTVFQA